MSNMDKIKIQISGDTWKLLNGLKRPGESFDDVLQRVVKENDKKVDFFTGELYYKFYDDGAGIVYRTSVDNKSWSPPLPVASAPQEAV